MSREKNILRSRNNKKLNVVTAELKLYHTCSENTKFNQIQYKLYSKKQGPSASQTATTQCTRESAKTRKEMKKSTY